MPLIHTADGEYLFAIDDHADTRNGRPQWVVYHGDTVVADRHSYEAAHVARPPVPPDPPDPPTDLPLPPVVGLGPQREIPVTDASDGTLINRGYAYYSAAFVSPGGETAFVLGATREQGPSVWGVDLHSEHVTRIGKLTGYPGEAEGWAWTPQGEIHLCDGSRYRRVNPFTGQDTVLYDLSDPTTGEGHHPGCDLWQPHSSDDGQVHSATVRQIVSDGKYPYLGTLVWYRGRPRYFPAIGDLDESALDSTGEFVVIKEKRDGLLHNRIIELATGITQTLTNAQGAVGHSDMGPGLLIGEWSPQHGEADGQCVLWDLRGPLVPERRRTLFYTWGMGHVSYRAGRCLLSGPQALSLLPLDGSGPQHLIDHGMAGEPHGNLDHSGRVAVFMSNHGTDRLDLSLLVLP